MKFVKDGMFLKLASTDPYGIYAGVNLLAAKSASHEIKSLQALIGANVRGLHFPLQVIVDYLGRRLSVSTILPIRGDETLLYGSSDGGRSICYGTPEFRQLIRGVAQKLNLKEHTVVGKRSGTSFRVYTPVDMEGHLGLDGRFYAVDCARLFCPEPPTDKPKGSVFCHLLRPECVAKNSVPLSSDSFTSFGEEDRAVHNSEARDAWLQIFAVRLPICARELDSLLGSATDPQTVEDWSTLSTSISSTLHSNGANLRLLLYVRAECRNLRACRFLLCEALARSIKQYFFASLRKIHSDILLFSKLTASVLLESLLARDAVSWEMWRQSLSTYFWHLNRDPPPTEHFDFTNDDINLRWLLLAVLNLTGIRLKISVEDAIRQKFISSDDVEEVAPKLKTISMTAQLEQLRQESAAGVPTALVLSQYETELSHLQERLGAGCHPQIAFALENCAEVAVAAGDFVKGQKYFQQSIEMRRQLEDPVALAESLSKFATAHHSFASYHEACGLAEEGHQLLCGALGETSQQAIAMLHQRAWMLKSFGNYPESATSFRRVIDLARNRKFDGLAESLVEYARVLMHLGKLEKSHGIEALQVEALALAEKTWGEAHSRVATILSNLAIYRGWKGELTQAIADCSRSLGIRRQRLGETHLYTGHSMALLGQLLGLSGDSVMAENYLKNAVLLYRSSKRADALASGLASLCRVYIKQGKFLEAQAVAMELVELVRSVPEQDQFATMLVDAACAHMSPPEAEASSVDLGSKLMRSAVDIRRACCSSDHPNVLLLNELAQLTFSNTIQVFERSARILVSQLTVYLPVRPNEAAVLT